MKDRLPRMPTLSALILAGGHSRRMGTDKALLPLPSSDLPNSDLQRSNSQRSNLHRRPVQNGQPLLLRTVEIAQQVATEVAIVTPWPSRYRTLLAATDVRLIQEPPVPHQSAPTGGHVGKSQDHQAQNQLSSRCKPSAGPMSGFAYGWQHMTSDWCLLLACDLPYLNADELTQWWNWIVSLSGQDKVAGSSHDLGSYPVDACVPMASLVPSERGWEPLCGFYHRSCLPSLNHEISESRRAFQPWLQQLSIVRYDSITAKMLFNCNTPAEWQSVVST